MNSVGERSPRNRNEGFVADQHKPQSGVGVWPGVDVRLELEFGLVPTPGYSREIANGGATGACDSDWPR